MCVVSRSIEAGPPPADLVFCPTLACRSVRPSIRRPGTPALSRPRAGQDLHLNRAMLSDQRSPYVGRFARGWRRLPEIIPGQPQTRTRARPSIGRSDLAQERAGGHEHRDTGRAVGQQRLRACAGRRPRGEHVVDEQHVTRRLHARRRHERSSHRVETSRGVPLGLGTGRDGPPQQPANRQVRLLADDDRERLGLIEASLGLAPPRERNPRDGIDRGLARHAGRHCGTERPADAPDPAVLQMVHGRTGRALERERCAGASDRGRRALPAAEPAFGRGRAAPFAPGRLQHAEAAAARRAERPWSLAAPGTPGRKHDVERPPEHRPTIRATSDRAPRPATAEGRRRPVRGSREPRSRASSAPWTRGRS